MKSWRRVLPLLASWLLIFFLAALPALAAEGAEEALGTVANEHERHDDPDCGYCRTAQLPG